MSTVIHGYPIPPGEAFTCNLPEGAEVVRAEFAMRPKDIMGAIMGPDGKPVAKQAVEEILMVFVKLDPDKPMKEYHFKVVPDDVPIEEMVYKTSAFARGMNCFVHLFQSTDA